MSNRSKSELVESAQPSRHWLTVSGACGIRLGVSLGAVALAALGAAAVQAQPVVTQNLVLTADHQGPLQIYTSFVTLDCQNFRVLQPYPLDQEEFPADALSNTGILISNATDVTVQNCRVEDFWWGIRIVGSTNVKLINNTVSEVVQPQAGWVVRRAFAVEGGYGNMLVGNTEADTNGDGFSLVTSDGNTLSGNVAGGGGNAYELFTAHDNRLVNNWASGGGDGFNIGGSNRNLMIANYASGQNSGFRLYSGSSENALRGNAITDNAVGILVCAELRELNSLDQNRFKNNGADIVEGGDGCM